MKNREQREILNTGMSEVKNAVALLKKNKVGIVKTEELLAKHSTWEIGGLADILVLPNSPQGISDTIRVAEELALPLVIVGGGSNLLFDDAGVRGIVIKLDRSLSTVDIKDNHIRAGAGVWVPCLARAAGKAGLTGIEHTVGIPGTFGGLIFMNGGSQRKSIGDLVQEVLVMNRHGKQFKLSSQDCGFAYRKSIFQENDLIILEAKLACQAGKPSEIRQEMLSILCSRSGKFPRKQPNCGSVFISDPAMYKSYGPPGKIIEDCKLKGVAIGDAEVSCQHANFIVNRGRATSGNVMALIDMVRREVYRKTSCWLKCEVRYVTASGKISPLHSFL